MFPCRAIDKIKFPTFTFGQRARKSNKKFFAQAGKNVLGLDMESFWPRTRPPLTTVVFIKNVVCKTNSTKILHQINGANFAIF